MALSVDERSSSSQIRLEDDLALGKVRQCLVEMSTGSAKEQRLLHQSMALTSRNYAASWSPFLIFAELGIVMIGSQ